MPLPTFVIAGERRSGTSSLAANLSTHPDIFIHPKRDRGYFIEDDARKGPQGNGADWEASHSIADYKRFFEDAGPQTQPLIGEKSADYLYWRNSHPRIAAFLPEAKFLITLRHPVKRAWSHYWNEVGKGRETLGFDQAIAAEEQRCTSNPYLANHLSYIRRGFYDESLLDFFQQIPRERVLVTTLESIISEKQKKLREIFLFLGVEPDRWVEGTGVEKNANRTMVPKPWASQGPLSGLAKGYAGASDKIVKAVVRDKSARRRAQQFVKSPFFESASTRKMQPESFQNLTNLYQPHIERLEEILGRRLAEWRS